MGQAIIYSNSGKFGYSKISIVRSKINPNAQRKKLYCSTRMNNLGIASSVL